MDWRRILRHLAYPDWWLSRRLPLATLRRVENAVSDTEVQHAGEIRVTVEPSLDLLPLLRGQSARERAVEVFSTLRVWDTEDNTGVLLYVLLADRDVEIVADRGIARVVPQEDWEAVCREMEARFLRRRHEDALLYGVREIGARLRRSHPHPGDNPDELPDRPVRL